MRRARLNRELGVLATAERRGAGIADGVRGVDTVAGAGMLTSGGSEDGGSEPKPCFSGVRNGDLKGLWSVLVASLRRRRLACGVDIAAFTTAVLECRCRTRMGCGRAMVEVRCDVAVAKWGKLWNALAHGITCTCSFSPSGVQHPSYRLWATLILYVDIITDYTYLQLNGYVPSIERDRNSSQCSHVAH